LKIMLNKKMRVSFLRKKGDKITGRVI